MTDQANNPLLTAYALGELDPQSDDYRAIAAQVADDPALQAQVEAIANLANQLKQSYEHSAGPGLDDTALSAIVNTSSIPIARLHHRPSLTRRLLPYAGVAACAALATAGIFMAMQTETPNQSRLVTDRPDQEQAVAPLPVVDQTPDPVAQTKAKLAKRITIDSTQSRAMVQVLDELAKSLGVQFMVNWPALEIVGIDQFTLVAMKMKDLPAHAVLDHLLQQVSADAFDDDKLGYRVGEGLIKISTRRDLKSDTDTRVYDFNQIVAQGTIITQIRGQLLAKLMPTADQSASRYDYDGSNGKDDFFGSFGHAADTNKNLVVTKYGSPHADETRYALDYYDSGDLIARVPNFRNAPSFDLNDSLSGTSSGGSGGGLFADDSGGGQGGLFGDDSYHNKEATGPQLTVEQMAFIDHRDELADDYVQLIQDNIGNQDEWLDEESTIEFVDGKFVVKTTPENHEAINRLFGLMANRPATLNEQQINELARNIIEDVELGLIGLEQRRVLREMELERRERFAELNDNPFKIAEHEPLSTFSVDVDTASYAFGRRAILTDKTLPEPNSVRIEEWINYFDYGYTAPVVDPKQLPNGRLTTTALEKLEAADQSFVPFATDVEVAQCPWTDGHQLVRIGIKAMEVEQADRPPAHLVFLLDVSGSMDSPDKLGLVQRGMPMLLDQLNDNDKVSIVVYAGASGLVLEAAEASDNNKIKEAIAQLSAGGSTAGAAGIQLAYEMAEKHFIVGGVNRVILCTDGDFNVGTSDTTALVELVKSKANPPREEGDSAKGVYLSVMGFGRGNLNDEMMEKITNAGNGNYAYIDSVNEAVKTMSSQAGGTLVTVAKDVKLQVEFNPAQVASYRLIGYENRVLRDEDFNNDTVDAGDIGAGHSVTALYEVVPVPVQVQKPAEQQPDIDDLRYQKPRGLAAAAELPELLTLKLRYKPVDAAAEQGTSRKVVKHVPTGAVDFAQASEPTRFAASVAALGMILRGSPHKGQATSAWVVETALNAKNHDPQGYRDEFCQLATQVGIEEARRDAAFRVDPKPAE